MSEKSVILHGEITSSQEDAVTVVGSARTHFAFSINLYVSLKKNFLWIWARRVRESGWSSGIACWWRSWRNWWRCGEKADIEGEGVDVVLGAPALAISGLELQSFIFSEIFREIDWRDRFVWVCFWHRSTSAMWIVKSSYLISFWFAGIIWRPLIFSIS